MAKLAARFRAIEHARCLAYSSPQIPSIAGKQTKFSCHRTGERPHRRLHLEPRKHDRRIRDHQFRRDGGPRRSCRLRTHLCPGVHLGGNVHCARQIYVGIGASVIHGIRIGEYAAIGACAAVIRDVGSSETDAVEIGRAAFHSREQCGSQIRHQGSSRCRSQK